MFPGDQSSAKTKATTQTGDGSVGIRAPASNGLHDERDEGYSYLIVVLGMGPEWRLSSTMSAFGAVKSLPHPVQPACHVSVGRLLKPGIKKGISFLGLCYYYSNNNNSNASTIKTN